MAAFPTGVTSQPGPLARLKTLARIQQTTCQRFFLASPGLGWLQSLSKDRGGRAGREQDAGAGEVFRSSVPCSGRSLPLGAEEDLSVLHACKGAGAGARREMLNSAIGASVCRQKTIAPVPLPYLTDTSSEVTLRSSWFTEGDVGKGYENLKQGSLS